MAKKATVTITDEDGHVQVWKLDLDEEGETLAMLAEDLGVPNYSGYPDQIPGGSD